MGAFIALVLTVNSVGLDTIDTVMAFKDEKSCRAYVSRERAKSKAKMACVSQHGFNAKRDEVFR